MYSAAYGLVVVNCVLLITFSTFDVKSPKVKALNISSDKTLMVYLLKHIDGITAYLSGHKSQREDVRGRIKDAIVYLMLLWAMVEERELNGK